MMDVKPVWHVVQAMMHRARLHCVWVEWRIRIPLLQKPWVMSERKIPRWFYKDSTRLRLRVFWPIKIIQRECQKSYNEQCSANTTFKKTVVHNVKGLDHVSGKRARAVRINECIIFDFSGSSIKLILTFELLYRNYIGTDFLNIQQRQPVLL